MVKSLKLVASGINLNIAKENLEGKIDKYTKENCLDRKNLIIVNYNVGVRRLGKAYIIGNENEDLQTAYDSALEEANVKDYDEEKYKTSIRAKFKIQKDAQTKKGNPSGTIESKEGKYLTDLF